MKAYYSLKRFFHEKIVSLKKSKSPVDTVELKMTSLPWNQKKWLCWEDDFLLTKFTVFFCASSFFQKVRFWSKKTLDVAMACQCICLFPFQPLHFGGGDVVQIGTSCFFFEVTWYMLIHFIAFIMIDHVFPPQKLHHTGSKEPTAPSTDKTRSPNDLFPMSRQCFSGHPKRSGSIWLLLPSRDILGFLFLHNVSTIPKKKNPVPTGGANGLRFFCKNIKNACWCMYLPKGEYSRCRSGVHQVLQVCKQVCNKTHPGFIYNDVEFFVQFTSNFYTWSGWFHSPKKSSPTQDETDQLQQAVYRVL